jgi:AraC-like DNA-binding protein
VDEYVRRAPAEVLRPYLACYTGYRQRGLPPAVHRGLPSPFLTLIFTLDEPLTMMAHPDPRQVPGIFGTLLGGLHTEPALIGHNGAQSGIQVALRPLGARALLGLPAGELAHIDVAADSVLGTVAARIQARVVAAASWRDRFAVLNDEFSRILEPGSLVAPEVTVAWRLLLRSGGTVPVSELAAQTGWSSRHLASRFRIETGLTPKAAARVIRFDHAKRQLLRVPGIGGASVRGASVRVAGPGGLAGLAAECGYFDQAHLAREFRALAGCPPSQWLAEEFRNVQASDLLSGEDSLV